MDLENLINEVEEEQRSGGLLSKISSPNFIFQRSVSEVSPKVKLGALLIGILLIPFFGFGLLIIWGILRQGPINEHTKVVNSKIYLKKHHGILQYETHNGRVKKAKFTPIDNDAFIIKKDGHHGESWTPDVTYTLITSNEKIKLLWLNGNHEIEAKKHIIPEFAGIVDLEIRPPEPDTIRDKISGTGQGLVILLIMIFVVNLFVFMFNLL
tara:strand:+ start:118 stop:747 length:630 start_codon:yes stop_codon:yes gene_type:complete